MGKSKKAQELYSTGMNCAQSVVAAYSDEIGLTQDKASDIGAGFGAGMYTGDTCGAVTAAIAVIGMKYGNDKMKVIKETQNFMKEFKIWGGTTNCIKLKSESGKRCSEIVEYSAKLLDKTL
jgi:C_GCAxxG_C_C family probable redox protein